MFLRFIITGGTFDKHYDPVKGELTFTETHLPDMIAQSRLTLPYVIEPLMLIDSLDMTDAHRQQILNACTTAMETQIILTHGTDTMVETAHVLGNARLNKTIVLTGAMIPFEMKNSDAMFNLGFACAAAQTLPQGVYIAMNGEVFAWDKVQKNKVVGRFEKV
jgi:L-asparaginase